MLSSFSRAACASLGSEPAAAAAAHKPVCWRKFSTVQRVPVHVEISHENCTAYSSGSGSHESLAGEVPGKKDGGGVTLPGRDYLINHIRLALQHIDFNVFFITTSCRAAAIPSSSFGTRGVALAPRISIQCESPERESRRHGPVATGTPWSGAREHHRQACILRQAERQSTYTLARRPASVPPHR